MPPFVHLIITRFNLQLWRGVTLDEAWYEQRFALFERFCLPSVLGQTNQNFTWLLLCDANTPPAHLARIEAYGLNAPIRAHTLNGFDLRQVRELIRSQLGDNRYLITTTLDNDDALAKRFVENLQLQFREQRFELLNFLHGYRFDVRTGRLYACDLKTNPFISLVERVGDSGEFFSIAGCLPHSTIADRFKVVVDVDTQPLWLQVIHDRNLEYTRTWGRPRVSRRRLAAEFALDDALSDARESELAISAQHVRAFVERRLIELLTPEQRAQLRAQLARRMRR